jgi:hypothetical protein
MAFTAFLNNLKKMKHLRDWIWSTAAARFSLLLNNLPRTLLLWTR